MPTYQYCCESCEHEWEEFKRMDDRKEPTLKPCPNCKKDNSIIIVIGNIPIGDPIRLGRIKPDSNFTDVLKAINKKYRTSMPV